MWSLHPPPIPIQHSSYWNARVARSQSFCDGFPPSEHPGCISQRPSGASRVPLGLHAACGGMNMHAVINRAEGPEHNAFLSLCFMVLLDDVFSLLNTDSDLDAWEWWSLRLPKMVFVHLGGFYFSFRGFTDVHWLSTFVQHVGQKDGRI